MSGGGPAGGSTRKLANAGAAASPRALTFGPIPVGGSIPAGWITNLSAHVPSSRCQTAKPLMPSANSIVAPLSAAFQSQPAPSRVVSMRWTKFGSGFSINPIQNESLPPLEPQPRPKGW